MYLDLEERMPDDDEAHFPHFGDTDVEEPDPETVEDLLYFDDEDD